MKTAKVFENGRSQAVRLSKGCRFLDHEVLVNKIGEIILVLYSIEFYKQFQNSVVENHIYTDGRTFLEIYKTDEPAFTELVNKTLIKTIVENNGLTAQHEYFRIDTFERLK